MYVDRCLRFPSRAVALAFAAQPPFSQRLGPAQTHAGGPGWALMEAGAGGVLRSAGVQGGVDENGEPTWATPPAALPGYHVIFTIDDARPTAAAVLAAIGASGFVVEPPASAPTWARD